ncbi:MAG: transposase [Pseudomonadota bacterium]
MSKEARRRFTPEFKEQAVARFSTPGATQSSVARERGVMPTQQKTLRLGLEAAGSAAAVLRQKAEAAELAELRRENRRLKEEVKVIRKSSVCFNGRRRNESEAHLRCRPCCIALRPADVPGSVGQPELVPRRARRRAETGGTAGSS